jgi:type 2 lantibiotic biosynthesis protein LanM
MKFFHRDIIEIAGRASTISERLKDSLPSDGIEANESLIKSRLEKWCQVVAQGNEERFAKRLSWDGLDIKSICRILGAVRLANEQPLADWVKLLEKVMQASTVVLETIKKGDLGTYWCLDTKEPIPFEEVYLPFIQVARQQLIACESSGYQLLSIDAYTSLERSLLLWLARLCSQTLELEFSIFRASKLNSLSRLLGRVQNNSLAREQYEEFIQRLLKDGLLSFFQEYSVLARLMVTATSFWVSAAEEFLQHLALDWLAIQQTFQSNAPLEQVVAIKPFLSDLHSQGRSVVLVTFNSGLKLVYKPKDLGLEVAYFQLLSWLNEHGVPLAFKSLQVINRLTHGWVEYVEHLPCEDEEAAERYYQRAGMLLCLLYCLDGTDCHYENLVANGEYPVLVDMETLMHPRVQEIDERGEETEAQFLANQQLGNSVLRTGLLPQWQFGTDGQKAYDISGLGGVVEQETSVRLPKWININTDTMALEYEYYKKRPSSNVVTLNSITLLPNNYVSEIIDGFRQMYRFLMEHREALLVQCQRLLAHQRVRFVFRDTRVYSSLLHNTLNPKFLRDGAERSIELDALSSTLLSSNSKPLFWPLLKAEQKALEQLDIPLFIARSDSNSLLIAPEQLIEKCFKEPSYEMVLSHLQNLNDTDLEQQIAMIQGSLYSRIACELNSVSMLEEVKLNLDAIAPLNQDEMVQQAVAIAKELRQRAICSDDGSATWIGMKYVHTAQRFQFQPISYSLFDGSCGVALFLAALKKVTGNTEFHNLALAALQPIRRHLQRTESRQKLAGDLGIGGAVGLGSIAYTLARISQFLNEPGILENARQAAYLITPERIAVEQQFDIIGGVAGAILGLLPVYDLTIDPGIWERAIACGNQLLNNRVVSKARYRSWATLGGKLLTGFSHGAAGIAYALLRLYASTQNTFFLEAGNEAIAYERSVFSLNAGNWPDFRSFMIGQTTFISSWCHGAPGIGLARLGSLRILDTPEIRQDIETAIRTTQQVSLEGIDHLCCGNLGRIEVLLVAAQKLPQPELLDLTQKQTSWVVTRAGKNSYFHLIPNFHREFYNPGFFQGKAGIGYQLLRLAYPNSLPSVLLWE